MYYWALVTSCCLFLLSVVATTDIKWGNIFGGAIPSALISNTCKFGNFSYCCEVTDRTLGYYPNNHGFAHRVHSTNWIHHKASSCNLTVEYTSSPYELKHFEYARKILSADALDKRFLMYSLIWEDIDEVAVWLDRINYHFSFYQQSRRPQAIPEPPHHDDMKYLSRFHFRSSCSNPSHNTEWHEWIEPLTVYGRHPVSLVSNAFNFTVSKGLIEWPEKKVSKSLNRMKREGICSTDYLLPANMETAKQRTKFRNSYNRKGSNNNNRKGSNNRHVANGTNTRNLLNPPRAFFFDAGTSTFDSSLAFFTCLYAQQGIPFDHVYGWEYTLLEPQAFWSRVPPPIKPHYTFLNIPVSADRDDEVRSFLNYIIDTVHESDFVAVKLDIDTPYIENKIASELLSNPEIRHLVDEFYFEHHYHCPIMGRFWGHGFPNELNGLKLDIFHSMEFFKNLRKHGIRSHMWV